MTVKVNSQLAIPWVCNCKQTSTRQCKWRYTKAYLSIEIIMELLFKQIAHGGEFDGTCGAKSLARVHGFDVPVLVTCHFLFKKWFLTIFWGMF